MFGWSTALPLLCLALAGAGVPIMLARLFEDTHHGLMQALALSCVVLVILGAVLFVAVYAEAGLDIALLAEHPVDSLRLFLWQGLRATIVWVPILLLTAISLGRGVEARRTARMVRRGKE